jgi:hypothetical protein
LQEKASGAWRIKDGIVRDAQTAGHSRTQIGFSFADVCLVEHFNANVSRAVVYLFAVDFVHFLFVSREPKGSALIVFNIGRELVNELLPQSAREMSKGELSFGIVHNDDMTHTGGGSAASDWPAVEDENLQSGAGAFSSAGSAHDSCADDDEIEGLGHEGKIIEGKLMESCAVVEWDELCMGVFADAPAEGIAFVEQQRGFGVDECGAGDGWRNFA